MDISTAHPPNTWQLKVLNGWRGSAKHQRNGKMSHTYLLSLLNGDLADLMVLFAVTFGSRWPLPKQVSLSQVIVKDTFSRGQRGRPQSPI